MIKGRNLNFFFENLGKLIIEINKCFPKFLPFSTLKLNFFSILTNFLFVINLMLTRNDSIIA